MTMYDTSFGMKDNPITISYSEVGSLAQCEQQHDYRYIQKVEVSAEKSYALTLGTSVHSLVDGIWVGGKAGLADAVKALYGTVSEDIWDHAKWLAERYLVQYGDEVSRYKVLEAEQHQEFVFPYAGNWWKLRFVLDKYFEDPYGNRWAAEHKTMSDWRKLQLLSIDPQPTVYTWAMANVGKPVQGVMFDAIRSYRWQPTTMTLADLDVIVAGEHPDWLKKEVRAESKRRQPSTAIERPVGESFEQEWLYRSEYEIEHALAGWFYPALDRKLQLLQARGSVLPLRNVGVNSCLNCDYQSQCWDELAGGVIVIEDDLEELA